MRWDSDAWADRFDRLQDLVDVVELAVLAMIAVGMAVGGLAALLGLDILPAFIVGVLVTAGGLVVLWVRARGRGTTLLDHD
jgi:predicted branched-subunit amino acid permease